MRVDPHPRISPCLLRAACFIALAGVAGNALSLPGRRMFGHYDFGYALRGDRVARPAQVFDDGAGKVYFETRPGQAMPAVFVGKEPVLLVTTAEGQYFTARTGESEFTLVLGGSRATVRRGDAALGAEALPVSENEGGRLLASADPGLPAGVDLGEPGPADGNDSAVSVLHEQPIVFGVGSAVLRPEVLDALTALVVRVGVETPMRAVGRNDAGHADTLAQRRAEALRNALLARGVPARGIEIAVGDPRAPEGTGRSHASSLQWHSRVAGAAFDIRVADHDIATALRRWARASRYEVVWDLPWSAPVIGGMRVDALTFVDAVTQVVAGLRAQGYPVQAQASSDRVVRFSATP